MLSKLFSVIIPIYNAELHLRKTLNSCIKQSYKNIEFILIDDGSTDGSLEICRQYANDDERIKVVHTDNCGVSHAKNCGIKIAEGDFLTFLDADDEIEPDYIEAMALAFSDDIDLIITDFDHWYASVDGIRVESNENFDISTLNVDILNDYRLLNSRLFSNWGKGFRLEIIKTNGIMFDEKMIMNEDQVFNDLYYSVMRGGL